LRAANENNLLLVHALDRQNKSLRRSLETASRPAQHDRIPDTVHVRRNATISLTSSLNPPAKMSERQAGAKNHSKILSLPSNTRPFFSAVPLRPGDPTKSAPAPAQRAPANHAFLSRARSGAKSPIEARLAPGLARDGRLVVGISERLWPLCSARSRRTIA